ncbi:hypothetical protein JNUCC32_31240 (plasmid) [Paenibacillus sp. JNUCC32]|uniref:hypothetical protein n=1 Tax=Paenibacillus sp. JNUCC32 TaxID=2777984 RepID=UPI001788024F|nr:hypothetical protein [Paenibacillus sp. JNUCC-32]QOT13763.1 hypothetical protein JNUCC32_31240 [Paenibacillus sp. JNUCC-32]
MDVLNTTGGGLSAPQIIVAICTAILSILLWAVGLYSLIRKETGNAAGNLICAILIGGVTLLVLADDNGREPIRHEVTLRPGHVIDATKYEIVEQRGKIYVIEEREVGE